MARRWFVPCIAATELDSLAVRFLRERFPPHSGGSQTWRGEAARVEQGLPAGEPRRLVLRIGIRQNGPGGRGRLLRLAQKTLPGGSSLSEYSGIETSR